MANNNTIGTVAGLDPSLTSPASTTTKTKNDQVDKNEFMTLLVTQLKNQDPLNPMDSQQFAVQLAQFSQLEQLTQINQKLGTDQNSTASLATYLDHEITYNSNEIQVAGGQAGSIKLNLAQSASSVKVAIVDSSGAVKQLLDVGALSPGKQTIPLKDLNVPNGQYQVKVGAIGVGGELFEPNFSLAGTVTGFVPGADPKLLVGSIAVSPGDVVEVGLPS